jgi:hypothetical protein
MGDRQNPELHPYVSNKTCQLRTRCLLAPATDNNLQTHTHAHAHPISLNGGFPTAEE